MHHHPRPSRIAGIPFLRAGAALLLAAAIGLSGPLAWAASKTPTTAATTTADKTWQIGATPAWVVDPGSAPTKHANAPRRDELVDIQSNYTGTAPQFYTRIRSVAKDASTVASISQWQIYFNPRYQKAVVHTVAVIRDGVRQDRMKTAQMELMRREQSLDRSQIDGVETLLVLLQDVRVGDTVEMSYTVIGSNPIFEGHIETNWTLATDIPVDLLHQRLVAPAQRKLTFRSLASDLVPEQTVTGKTQELRLVRRNVEAAPHENDVPPWIKVYPDLSISDFTSWQEVEDWAGRLFAQASVPDADIQAAIADFQKTGLRDQALLSAVLRFVQDDIRYFSVSLGESSHRPKPAARTLKERFGDCKDKVVLLNTLLTGLGFDARPALVSTYRNRGLAQFAPGTSQLDHAISRVTVQGQVFFVDPTMTSQGLNMDSRGQANYGLAIVPGSDGVLQPMAQPPADLNTLAFEQQWDISTPGQDLGFTAIMRAHGLQAESTRVNIAANGIKPMAEYLMGGFSRMYPGLKPVGEPVANDSRETNTFEIRQQFAVPNPGEYQSGSINYEFGAIELMQFLVGPAESRRHFSFYLNVPTRVDSKIVVTTAKALSPRTPAPIEVLDKNFRLASRVQIDGKSMVLLRTYERRTEEVAPADLDAYRQAILRARGFAFTRFRDSFTEGDKLRSQYERLAVATRNRVGVREDKLFEIMFRAEVDALLDSNALQALPAQGTLTAKALVSRAKSYNTLGEFKKGLEDADAALKAAPPTDSARDARGVALIGLGRLDEALAELQQIDSSEEKGNARHWIGALLAHMGRYAESEKVLREALGVSDGEQRDYVLLGLYIAAEGAGKNGREAITAYAANADAGKIPGALLRYFNGQMDLKAVYQLAEADNNMRRLNLAEVNFYAGMQSLVQGDSATSKRRMLEVLETGALPYREHTFASLMQK